MVDGPPSTSGAWVAWTAVGLTLANVAFLGWVLPTYQEVRSQPVRPLSTRAVPIADVPAATGIVRISANPRCTALLASLRAMNEGAGSSQPNLREADINEILVTSGCGAPPPPPGAP